MLEENKNPKYQIKDSEAGYYHVEILRKVIYAEAKTLENRYNIQIFVKLILSCISENNLFKIVKTFPNIVTFARTEPGFLYEKLNKVPGLPIVSGKKFLGFQKYTFGKPLIGNALMNLLKLI